MKLIIPMAGMGKRLRPHTLDIPKPLVKIAGKPIVERIVESINRIDSVTIEEIIFIIGNFGSKVEEQLKDIAKNFNSKATICYQKDALGTAHAISCANNALNGEIIVAFADTLFFGNMKPDIHSDGNIWVKEVDDPSKFGVVKTNEKNIITDFIEKPKDNISNKAIIGIYYFKQAENLKREIDYIIQNDIRGNNEYQLTDALENLKSKGMQFSVNIIDEWLDCGNVAAVLYANKRILQTEGTSINRLQNNNSQIIEPCYIENDVILTNSVIGPYVTIYANANIENSIIKNSIVDYNSYINNSVINNSFIGKNNILNQMNGEFSTGNYTKCN
jgi:glucose-1-phosphate thymidylyltransferase